MLLHIAMTQPPSPSVGAETAQVGGHRQPQQHQSRIAPPFQGGSPTGQIPGFPGQATRQGAREEGEGRREALPQLPDRRLHPYQEP